MSAFDILVTELARHGSVTYAQLLRRHPTYSMTNFANAVHTARKLGLATKEGGHGTPIVAVGCCPTCGRKL